MQNARKVTSTFFFYKEILNKNKLKYMNIVRNSYGSKIYLLKKKDKIYFVNIAIDCTINYFEKRLNKSFVIQKQKMPISF